MPAAPEFWYDWSSLFLFGGLLNVALAIYFTSVQYRMLAKPLALLWLFLLLICLFVILLEQLVRNSSLIGHIPGFLFISSPLLFLYLPLILFYHYAILQERIVYAYHLLLPFASLAVMIPTYLMPGPQKLDMFFDRNISDPLWIISVYLLYCTYYLFRIFYANKLLRKRVKNESANDKIEYYTLANNIISKVGVFALIFPLSLLMQYVPVPVSIYSFSQKLLFVGFSISGHLILFSLLLHRNSLGYTLPDKVSPTVEQNVEPSIDLLAKKQELVTAMSTQKYYLKKGLTLNFLAQELGWSRTSLSFIINNGFGQNFYDFINSFRIEAVEALLRQEAHQKFSLDHIVMECGFSNYTSFYRIFKRIRHQTPSAFIKALNKQ